MSAGGLVHRYLPFLFIAALQLATLTVVDAKGTGDASGVAAVGSGPSPDTGVASGGSAPTAGSIDPVTGATVPGTSGAAGSPSASGDAAAGPAAGNGVAGAASATTGGDRSKCAPGGILQQDITDYSPPCVPRFTGDNGGSTYPGVTKDEITAVYYLPKGDEAINAALATQGLSISPEKNREVLGLFEKFFNKHYEMYGRTLKWIQFDGTCATGDFVCYRNDAKALVTKHKPFLAVWYGGPWQFADELSRMGVLAVGSSWGMPKSWYRAHRPFVWDLFADGNIVADTVASYWCSKMAGKNATLAGDPQLQLKPRQLAIISSEDPHQREVAEHLRKQVTGGMCGSSSEKHQTYAHSVDTSKAQEQFPPLVAKMKADGHTTVIHIQGGAIGYTPFFDNERYYPEHLLSGVNASDHDFLGRFQTPTQWRNAFGPSWRPKEIPVQQQDDYKAVKEVAPDYPYGDSYVALAMFLWTHMSAMLIQSAGPNLTPETWEQGAFAHVQMGGYANDAPWEGWKCCDPLVPEWKFGPDDYSAHQDAKEVYWDPNAPSPIDNKPGSYVCVNNCHRYRPGAWPKGEPKR